MSPVVHAFPSLQALVLFVNEQPVAGLHVSSVQGLPSLQTVPVPGWQLPPPQVSPDVQGLPSSQAAVLLVNTQPVAGLQVSVVHTFVSAQTTGVPGWQLPPPQVSPVVHTLPSSQALALLVNTHPVAGLHESSVQGLLSLHTVPVPGWQLPPPQVSPVVQGLPSLQAAVLFVNTHPVAGLHESLVQGLPSLQAVAAPGWQLPPPQTSPVVHALPSLQGAVLFVWEQPVTALHRSLVHGLESLHWVAVVSVKTQPVAGLQLSAVQTLLSLQTTAVPGRQTPI